MTQPDLLLVVLDDHGAVDVTDWLMPRFWAWCWTRVANDPRKMGPLPKTGPQYVDLTVTLRAQMHE